MSSHVAITCTLVLAWCAVGLIGLASLAMAHHVGNRYVYTSPGLSRTGPPDGVNIATRAVTSNGMGSSIARLLAQDRPTMLVFLSTISQPSIQFIPELLKFDTETDRCFKLVVLFRGEREEIMNLFQYQDYVYVDLLFENPKLMQDLGVRVLPFALLIDSDGIVISKGLTNHIQHLCLLTNTAEAKLGRRLLPRTAHICEPHAIGVPVSAISRIE